MRISTRIIPLAVAVLALAIWSSPTQAFHDEGVADCAGCHTMHNSQDGLLVDPDSPDGNAFLLKDATPSDICLRCHATRHGAVYAVAPLTPAPEKGGGNFIFLDEDNINDGHGGSTNAVLGHQAGHSIVAPSETLVADPLLGTAPGGTFPGAVLGCSSCHDPHGNTNFRLLYGTGLVQAFYTFTADAPAATGIDIEDAVAESNSHHTAYQGTATANVSAWCGNCHGNYHQNATQARHPSGETLGGTIATNYGLYNGTAQYGTGIAADSYLAVVAFDDPANTTSSTAGPSASSQVMCLTCHRAHASSAMDAGRWDFQVTLLSEDADESGSYEIPDPYSDPGNQRSLCNKCHVKDKGDLGSAP
jgi:hypothetical protein